jgi:hypothetical protein
MPGVTYTAAPTEFVTPNPSITIDPSLSVTVTPSYSVYGTMTPTVTNKINVSPTKLDALPETGGDNAKDDKTVLGIALIVMGIMIISGLVWVTIGAKARAKS